ncbi:MAG: TerB N-terminal domain-containing protein [Oscillospiraceae bacterium]|nr:TerB N-terminal domain-containing protein [Oscillospiraceae bacterium]
MELAELVEYCEKKYKIKEDFRWPDHPGYSVLLHPYTGKWAALLIRKKDPVSGNVLQVCDICCGKAARAQFSSDHISAPYRMKSEDWVGVRFDGLTDPDMVRRLINRAMFYGFQKSAVIVLGSDVNSKEVRYTDTPLPPPKKKHMARNTSHTSPDRIREMRRLYEYGYPSFENNCRNFYIQGKFMEDYEDDAPWNGQLTKYYPTYHDLTTEQLRGYFTWRTDVRRGIFKKISTSLAYIYVYELLNGIGASSPTDSLEKLDIFLKGFVESGIGDKWMSSYIRGWMTELAVINALPVDITRKYSDEKLFIKDSALDVLKNCAEHTDDEVFDALFTFGNKKSLSSSVFTEWPTECRHLFASAWRSAAEKYREGGKKLMTLCFGECRSAVWHPLKNAIYYRREKMQDMTYELTPCRSYTLKDGCWREKAYRDYHFEKTIFNGFLHETERQIRLYLKEGAPLKQQPSEQWAASYIEAVIEADREEKRKAAAKNIEIRFGDLDKIRQDALHTQNSLLTEEERSPDIISDTDMPDFDNIPETDGYEEESGTVDIIPADAAAQEMISSSCSLDERQLTVLQMLLDGQSVRSIIREWGQMMEIFAEGINEALFDEIGDTAVECDGEDITLTEDYREDIERIMGR